MENEESLHSAREKIKENAYYMKMALDASNLKEAMKKGKLMLSQLRINDVSPKDYYSLFMEVFDELQLLEEAFRDEYNRKKIKFSKIYEKVQYSDEIIPRLYLMITAGSVLIDTDEITAKAVVQDLLGMLKGVQHPFRGLFLRYYFLKMIKDKIPDGRDEDYQEVLEREFGSLDTIIEILLENLAEMNKLWIRINTLFKDKKRKKQERQDLKITVGENIVRLSGMEGVTLDVYKEKVLPPLLEHITSTNDKISQQYLMDCIIHAFPDEYHIATLDIFLNRAEHLNPKVELRLIYIKLMERFAEYSKNKESEEEQENETSLGDMHFIYEKFKQSIRNIIDGVNLDENFRLDKLLELLAAFINFCVQTYPDKIEYVDQIVDLSVNLCSKVPQERYNEKELDCMVNILTYPLEKMSICVLNLTNYPILMALLPFERRKIVAIKIVEAILSTRTFLVNESIVTKLINFVLPLIELQEDTVRMKAKDLEYEQTLIARMLHYVQSHDANVTFKMLKLFEAKFSEGPAEWRKFTIPSLVSGYLRICQRYMEFQKLTQDGEIIKDVYGTRYDYRDFAPYLTEFEREAYSFEVTAITVDMNALLEDLFTIIEELSLDYPSISLKLYFDLGLIVSQLDTAEKTHDELQYDICSEALELFQDEIADSKEKKVHLQYIIGALMNIKNLTDENIESLYRNVTSFCSSMLKKHDKVMMLCKATHLYYSEACVRFQESNSKKNEEKINEILRKSLKIAKNACRRKPDSAFVYIHILDKIVFYYNAGVQSIGTAEINACIKIIKENLGIVSEKVKDSIQISLERILVYLAKRKELDAEKWGPVDL